MTSPTSNTERFFRSRPAIYLAAWIGVSLGNIVTPHIEPYTRNPGESRTETLYRQLGSCIDYGVSVAQDDRPETIERIAACLAIYEPPDDQTTRLLIRESVADA